MHLSTKKIISFLLALCLIVGVLPVSAQAALLDGADYITQQLSLGEDLVLHLQGYVPENYKDGATATVSYAGKTDTYTINDMTPDENGLYDLPVELAVAQMTDEINLILNAKYLGMNVEAINEVYSIQNYLMTILEGDYSQMTMDLCLELLNLGSRAQEYFDYNTDNLADAGNSITPANAVPAESPAVSVTGSVDGISFYGASVRFLSKTAVRFYFEAEGGVDSYTFTIDGTEYEPVAKDGMYYIETPGINPQNMSKEISVSVTDGTKTLSFNYAPMWYFIRNYNKTTNDTFKNLMAAAYSYYKEAETYTTNICLDVEITTLGNSTEDIDIGFFPLNFEGDINNTTDKVTVKAGTTTTVTLEQGQYLVDGKLSGIGLAIFGGPEWNTTLEDGTNDKHTIKISNMRLEGAGERSIDMSNATVATGNTDTGYTNANSFGTASVVDGAIVISGGCRYDAHKITLNEIETYLCVDMLITTLGNSTDPVDVGFYPHNFEGDINNMTDSVTITAGTTATVKLDMSKYLVDGEVPGIGFAIFGGPTWDATLEDGTADRHTITISNMRLEGAVNRPFDLNYTVVASGSDGTGYTNANGSGKATVADGTIVISDGFRFDGHKITFTDELPEPEVTEPEATEPEATEPEATEPPVEEPDTYICLDMLLTTLGNSSDPVEIGFYPYNFEGDIGNFTDKIAVTAGTTSTVKLDLSKYLVDGELPGIGFVVLGGPEWNTTLADGSPDKHTLTVSNVKLVGKQSESYDLSASAWTNGTNAGYTNANNWGQAAIGSSIVISGGIRFDGHKITLVKVPDTYLCLDMLITTLGNSTEDVEIGFYPYNFEGDINNHIDRVAITAGTASTVKLDLSKYLVDGELPGIGFAIFGGPTWDATLADGTTPDRHTLTISSVKLVGEQSATYDLSQSQWANGNNGTGYTNANSSGTAVIGESIVISGGFRFDGHKITLVKAPDTYISLDMLITTLGNSAEDIEIGFYPYNFEGDINYYTEKLAIKAGTTTTVKLDLSKYLVDGELPGIGFVVLGGPEWNTTLADGSPDKHTLTVSNVKLVGKQSESYDLSASAWTNGTNAGYTNGNNWGQATIGSSIVISGGIRFDGHKITLVEEPDTYLCLDMLITTLSNSTEPVDVGFYPYNFEGDINNHVDRVAITAGTTTTVKLDLNKYLVDGELTGIGFAIFGGPTWDATLADGTTPDRHTLTISGVKLVGEQSAIYDLSQSQWANGNNGTGYTNANGSGTAVIGESIVISGGFCFDGHKITLVEDTNTYICMDVLFTTLGNSTDPLYVRYFSHDFAGEFFGEEYIDNVLITAGTKKTVRLKVDNYLINGELPGIGFGIFGGPEWNSTLEDGTADRHSVIISNIHMEGPAAEAIELSAVVKGLSNSNTGGTAQIVDGTIVITDGYRFDGYQFTF